MDSTYRDSLKSTAVIGGSQVVTIAIGAVRSKVMAVLLGPSGIALFGLYQSAVGMVGAIAGAGVQQSGVRQIAAARAENDPEHVAAVALALRRLTVVLGLAGAVALFLLREHISRVTFGNQERAGAFGLLAVLVFFQIVAGGYQAMIQGYRRIRDLALQRILGAIWGVALAVPLVLWLGEAGVAWSMLTTGMAVCGTAWWFSRRIHVRTLGVSLSIAVREARGLVSLGLVFMANAIMVASVAFGTKAFVTRYLGLDATGLFQASVQISGLYVGIVLHAMGADFYPRLTGVATENPKINQMVNEQAEVSVLLAAPGVIGTLVFAPLVLSLLYTPQFLAATTILRWQVLGAFARVIIWPMGFIPIAMGAKWYFMGLQIVANVAHAGFLVLAAMLFGLPGLGVAFFALYVFHAGPALFVARRLSNFSWSRANRRHWLVLFPVIGLTFVIVTYLPVVPAMILGTLAMIMAGLYGLCHLLQVTSWPGENRVPSFVTRALRNLCEDLQRKRKP